MLYERIPQPEVSTDALWLTVPDYHERMCAVSFMVHEWMARDCGLTLEKVGPDAHVQAMLDHGWKGNL